MRPFRGSLGFWTALISAVWLLSLEAAPALAGLAVASAAAVSPPQAPPLDRATHPASITAHTAPTQLREHAIRLPVPVIAQVPERCGPAALAMVLRFHGAPDSAVAEAGRAYSPALRGALISDLARAAERAGFAARAARAARSGVMPGAVSRPLRLAAPQLRFSSRHSSVARASSSSTIRSQPLSTTTSA